VLILPFVTLQKLNSDTKKKREGRRAHRSEKRGNSFLAAVTNRRKGILRARLVGHDRLESGVKGRKAASGTVPRKR